MFQKNNYEFSKSYERRIEYFAYWDKLAIRKGTSYENK